MGFLKNLSERSDLSDPMFFTNSDEDISETSERRTLQSDVDREENTERSHYPRHRTQGEA